MSLMQIQTHQFCVYLTWFNPTEGFTQFKGIPMKASLSADSPMTTLKVSQQNTPYA